MPPGYYYGRFRLTRWVAGHVGQLIVRLMGGLRETFAWVHQQAKMDFKPGPPGVRHKRPLLELLLIVLPIGVLAALGPREWFLNWPVMFVGAALLTGILMGPLTAAPSFLRKIAQLGVSVCLLQGLVMFLDWKPFMTAIGLTRRETFFLVMLAIMIWFSAVLWIVFSKPKRAAVGGRLGQEVRHSLRNQVPREALPESATAEVPHLRFADVGGMEKEKEQIRQLVQAQLNPGKYNRYGVVRNGILLHGPRGSGKTFLAKATAGEFGLRFHSVAATELFEMWIGTTGANIRNEFARAGAERPVLFFIDEIDSLGTGRQMTSGRADPGGAGREFNSMVLQLTRSIDQYRVLPGYVLMAATNLLDQLDESLIRDGRFDVKIRVDLPSEETRLKIFRAQLSTKPWSRCDLQEFAHKSPGWSAARICALIDQAAGFAAEEGRKIEERDLRRAMAEGGGKDRPLFQPVEWEELVVEEDVERELRTLIRLLDDPGAVEKVRVPIPTGLLLLGPAGTGKTMIARLIATQTRRSFYPLTAADVLGGYVGDSVKRVSQVFERAKEHSPSLIFLDEMDGLLPRSGAYLGQHDIQLVEQFMIEISNLQPQHNVFLVGTTNHAENIDPRVLRGGRFSEKIEIGLPSCSNRERLLRKYLDGATLAPNLDIGQLAERLGELAPADLEAITNAAKRFAFERMVDGQQLPPLAWADFEKAVVRVRGTA